MDEGWMEDNGGMDASEREQVIACVRCHIKQPLLFAIPRQHTCSCSSTGCANIQEALGNTMHIAGDLPWQRLDCV